VVIEVVIYYLELVRKILYRTNVIARRSLPKQSPVLWEFQIKEDCRAAKEQEWRLAMT